MERDNMDVELKKMSASGSYNAADASPGPWFSGRVAVLGPSAHCPIARGACPAPSARAVGAQTRPALALSMGAPSLTEKASSFFTGPLSRTETKPALDDVLNL